MEVQVSEKGELRIPAVHTAVDAGTVVNPETVRAQFEGAAVFGTSIARSGEITATNGVIDQSNFHNYQVARMNQAPYVPALCNAIFAATGKRIRELPLSRSGIT